MNTILNEAQLMEGIHSVNPSIVPAENPYSRWDMESNKSIIELKSRRTHYNTLMIERAKWVALRTEAKTSNKGAYYIVSTPEGIWMFNTEFEPEWEERYLPSHTDFRSHNKRKIVGFYHINDGERVFQLENFFNTQND